MKGAGLELGEGQAAWEWRWALSHPHLVQGPSVLAA